MDISEANFVHKFHFYFFLVLDADFDEETTPPPPEEPKSDDENNYPTEDDVTHKNDEDSATSDEIPQDTPVSEDDGGTTEVDYDNFDYDYEYYGVTEKEPEGKFL